MRTTAKRERTPAQIAHAEKMKDAAGARKALEAELEAARQRIEALEVGLSGGDSEELARIKAENARLRKEIENPARVAGQYTLEDQDRANIASMREFHQRAAVEFNVTPKEGLHYCLFEMTHDHDTRLSHYYRMGYEVAVELRQGKMYLLACPIERWQKNADDEVARDAAQRSGWKQVASQDLATGDGLNGGVAFATVKRSTESVTVTMPG